MISEKLCYSCPDEVQQTCAKSLTQHHGKALCDMLKEGHVTLEQKEGYVQVSDDEVTITVRG